MRIRPLIPGYSGLLKLWLRGDSGVKNGLKILICLCKLRVLGCFASDARPTDDVDLLLVAEIEAQSRCDHVGAAMDAVEHPKHT